MLVIQDPVYIQLHFQSGRGMVYMFSQIGRFGQNGKVNLGLNASSFAHNCGCMVDGDTLWQQCEYYYY